MTIQHTHRYLSILVLVAAVLMPACQTGDPTEGKIPITTISGEARELYLQGRDLTEKLRITDARQYAEQAVERDEDFALGHLMMANTATTATEFFDSLQQAVHLAGDASEGEKSIILGFAAGVKGDVQGQLGHYSSLVASYPEDERAHNLLGQYHFGRQEWQQAIEQYRKATQINPDFSQPYNQLGYALRFVGDYEGAERAFQEYIRLIPGEPNPYDSYAELLMKTGRFEESIENYRIALEKNPKFVASFIGIGNNQIFLKRFEEARATFRELAAIARNDGERRQAEFWAAVSYLHEGGTDQALQAVQAMYDIAKETDDLATMSGDAVLMGNILLHGGVTADARHRFEEAVDLSDRSDALEEVKETTRRNHLYNLARLALVEGDLENAREITARFGGKVAEHGIPNEVRLHHQLEGLIALKAGDHAAAVTSLEQANQQDPRVLYWMAVACKEADDLERAKELCARSASWNALAINYAYIREDATRLLENL